MAKYTVDIVPNYVAPEGPLADNKAYVDFVMNNAALSYMNQYGVATPDEGIAAALEAYNASLPEEAAPVVEPEA